jgi:hypothetical protein
MVCPGRFELSDAFTCLQTLMSPLASEVSSFSLRNSISPTPTALTLSGIGIVRALADRLCTELLPVCPVESAGSWVEPSCALSLGLVSLQSSIAFKGARQRAHHCPLAMPSPVSHHSGRCCIICETWANVWPADAESWIQEWERVYNKMWLH